MARHEKTEERRRRDLFPTERQPAVHEIRLLRDDVAAGGMALFRSGGTDDAIALLDAARARLERLVATLKATPPEEPPG